MSKLPIALALLSAALFGAAAPLSKGLLRELSPPQLAGLLYLGAALGAAPMAARAGGRVAFPRSGVGRTRLLGAIALGGALGPVLMLAGLASAGAIEVSLWLNLEGVFTAALGALWFRDPLTRSGWLGAAGALSACALLSAGGGMASLVAASFIAAACVCWALDNHWTALLGELSPAAITLWKGAVAGAVNLALGLAFAPWHARLGAVAAALATGAICYGASISLTVSAARLLGATRAQLAFASAPFFGVAFAVLGLGEPFGAREAFAGLLMAGSLALVLRSQHAHWHLHRAATHTHWHRHDDGHHAHAHGGEAAAAAHSHWHEHEPFAHAHPHRPDLHHRHAHPEET